MKDIKYVIKQLQILGGGNIWQNQMLCKGLFMDIAPKMRKERILLDEIIHTGMIRYLIEATKDESNREALYEQVISYMEEHYYYSREAVHSFCISFAEAIIEVTQEEKISLDIPSDDKTGWIFINDSGFLAGLNNRTDIHIVNGAVRKEDLSNLLTLDLHGYNIVDIAPLKYCTSLKCCNLSNNRISEISPLRYCSEMKELALSFNSIRNLSPLSYMRNLHILEMEYNMIVDLSPLQGVVNLRMLILGHNRLQSLKGLGNQPRLQYLELEDNSIIDCSELLSLQSLEILCLNNNPLNDCTALLSLPLLKIIVLNETPCAKTHFPIIVRQ